MLRLAVICQNLTFYSHLSTLTFADCFRQPFAQSHCHCGSGSHVHNATRRKEQEKNRNGLCAAMFHLVEYYPFLVNRIAKKEREREKAKVWNKKPRNKHFVRADQCLTQRKHSFRMLYFRNENQKKRETRCRAMCNKGRKRKIQTKQTPLIIYCNLLLFFVSTIALVEGKDVNRQ